MSQGLRRRIALGDGRALAYRVYGDPHGELVLSCHGGLMSGLDAATGHEVARALGIALVSPDRPGIGGSSRSPGRTPLAWAHFDVGALLEHLASPAGGGLDTSRFAVTGWSEGGQYALAVAKAFPSRVSAVAVVAGALPLIDPAVFAELNRTDKRVAGLSLRAPTLAALGFAATRGLARAFPRLTAEASAAALDASDTVLLARHSAWFARCVAEGVADPRGAVDSYRAFVGPWGFPPASVTVPVVVHQGSADRLIPAAWAARLVEVLPDARLRSYPDEGHFIVLSRRAEVLSSLLSPA
ncbi:alpha/beta hydrolase [Herbiconiux sp. CPCC 205716]|uniref:Alpha/beta hydrolase n=1 Tax=Herbiconiux gentiana TaxID=2970912 RepID=A0ABT2GH23_9MICO|nr:alpha/beta hydrolase [Herbiconiux gentiana]MCS5715528.1 alpha/beta hydrolase [Herbiconiux gentiana]